MFTLSFDAKIYYFLSLIALTATIYFQLIADTPLAEKTAIYLYILLVV
jgi:hypothetical protein